MKSTIISWDGSIISIVPIFRIFIVIFIIALLFTELFYTEKSHVRNLKILDKLFYRPMLKDGSISQEFTKNLFPNLETMIQLHSKYRYDPNFFDLQVWGNTVDTDETLWSWSSGLAIPSAVFWHFYVKPHFSNLKIFRGVRTFCLNFLSDLLGSKNWQTKEASNYTKTCGCRRRLEEWSPQALFCLTS